MMSEVTSEEDFGSSESETDSEISYPENWTYERHATPQETTPKCSMVFFILGVSLVAPFMTFVCAAEDVLAGTNKPTGLVIIALTAPSLVLKIVSLCFRHVPHVARIFLASSFVVAGQLCAVFIPHLGGRFVGICLVSVGTGIGEVSLFVLAAKELEEIALCSLITATGAGGVLGAVEYVGLTVWATVDPRTAILLSAIWPPIFLITFAVSRRNLHIVRHAHTPESLSRLQLLKFELDCSLTSRWRERLLSVWNCFHHMIMLFLVYFSEYIILSAILTTLVFDGTGDGPEFTPRGHFEHYVLSTMVGEFLGRTFISMLRSVAPGFFFTTSPILAFFPLSESIFLVLAAWYRLVPKVWIIWLLCFVQGTACGMIFSNSYHLIARRYISSHVIFNINLASILETAGILTAGLLGIHIELVLKEQCLRHVGNESLCLTKSMDSSFWEYGNRFNYDGKTAISL